MAPGAPSPRPGTGPSPRPGTGPSPRPGTGPSPRPSSDTGPRASTGTGLLASTDLAALAAHVGELLADAGVGATPDRRGRFAAAIQLARPAYLDEVYWLGRVTLVAERSQIAVWDRVFAQVFRGMSDVAEWRGDSTARPQPPPPGAVRPRPTVLPEEAGGSGGPDPAPPRSSTGAENAAAGREAVLLAASSEERLRHADFARLTDDEVVQLRLLMARLALVAPPRRSRRTVASRNGPLVDVRSTLSKSRRTAGEPVVLRRRYRRSRPRKLVFLCDVSGSMEPYSRAYLQLLLSAVGGARAEAFVFATRLTRLTRLLRVSDVDGALRRAGQAAPDWSGGTRIGDAVKSFLDGYGRRGMARGAVVVIISDGWERGDPAALGEQMGRLHRLADRVVWVNPRRASERYQPLVGGMAAALPHVDEFVSGRSVAALDEVLAAIEGRSRPGRAPKRY